MSHLTEREKLVQKAIAEASFEDTCNILVWSGYSDNYTDELDSYPTTASGVSCGFTYGKSMENERGQIVILESEAILRLSLEQELSVKDKVEVRNKIFFVDGVTEGSTVKVVNLKELESNE